MFLLDLSAIEKYRTVDGIKFEPDGANFFNIEGREGQEGQEGENQKVNRRFRVVEEGEHVYIKGGGGQFKEGWLTEVYDFKWPAIVILDA